MPMIAVLFLSLLQEAAPTGGPRVGSESPRPRAVLVGCGEYPQLRSALGEERYAREIRLAGPANDVALVQATLARVLGIAPSSTTVLAGWGDDPATRPTRANVLAALARLAREIEPGALAVVYLAGHGSQQRIQREKADEPDGLDEVFLPADAARARDGVIPGAIRDDELGQHVQAIRDAGADVWLIVDACHSGTLLRGADAESGVRLRRIDPAALGVEEPRVARASTRAEPPRGWIGGDEPRIAAFYATQSYGRAPEMPIPRGGAVVHGLFTWILCQELERTRGRVGYRELAARVVAAYQAFPCSLTVPFAEGDLAREVASGATAPGPPLLASLRAGEPWLDQGRFAGLEPGARVRVSDGAGRAVATLEVVHAEALAARCRLLEGALPPDERLAAECFERPGRDWSLGVALVRPDGTPLLPEALPERARAALAEERERLPLVESSAADWRIVVGDGGRIWLRPGGREGGPDLLDVDATSLVGRLRTLQTTRNLRRAASEVVTAGDGAELDLWIERKERTGVRPLAPGAELHPGDEIRIRLAKRGERILDVNVFYLDANHRRQLLLTRRLEAGANAALALSDWLTVTDDALGLEQLLVLATPRGPADPRVDLAWLAEDGALRGAARGALAEVLADLASGRNLRGEALGASAEVDATRSLLVPLRTQWRALAAPPWPDGEALVLPAPMASAEVPDAPPDPLACGPRALLVRSAGSETLDTLLVGGERVRAVLLDLDRDSGLDALSAAELAAALAARRFDAEAAFLFGDDARWASYDSRGSGTLDRVAVDRDADGTAEELRVLEDGRWCVLIGMAVPWASQQHLHRPAGTPAANEAWTARFAILQGEP